VRALMRLPSTTVASSTQSTPALTMSSRMAAILVARRPLRMYPAGVADEGDGLGVAVEGTDQIEDVVVAPQLVGRVPAWDHENVEAGGAHGGGSRIGLDRSVALLA
jgi:hypothetical protein